MVEKDKNYYIKLLQDMSAKQGRLPQKSDFNEYDVMRIKGFFGPWPWALEEAGLKPAKKQQRVEKNRQKHLSSKEKRK